MAIFTALAQRGPYLTDTAGNFRYDSAPVSSQT
jgi:hypothetical protein